MIDLLIYLFLYYVYLSSIRIYFEPQKVGHLLFFDNVSMNFELLTKT